MSKVGKNRATTQAKMDYVSEVVKSDPTLTKRGVAMMVKEKFGKTLIAAKLKQAFVDAGGKVLPPGRPKSTNAKSLGKRGKTKATRKIQLPRRKLGRKPGRRKTDVQASLTIDGLRTMLPFVAIVQVKDGPAVHQFDAQDQLMKFVQDQLKSGTPLPALACYVRQPLEFMMAV